MSSFEIQSKLLYVQISKHLCDRKEQEKKTIRKTYEIKMMNGANTYEFRLMNENKNVPTYSLRSICAKPRRIVLLVLRIFGLDALLIRIPNLYFDDLTEK